MLEQLPDTDPEETQEWTDALEAVVAQNGPRHARLLLRRLLAHADTLGVDLPPVATSDYINTVSAAAEPAYPGDEHIEARLRAIIRWNAAAIVARANRGNLGLGGHMASYASMAELFEVGFNHFFRGRDNGPGDQLFLQGHSSPGIYARGYLEGRFTTGQLDRFRQETLADSLPSYPHPRLLPDFWEFPTVSMGLSPLNAIYQARFNRYLGRQGFADTSASRVWAFMGDGEMDEPESLGALAVAAREELDNLTFVVNCNLQRLDGPVRGNSHVIQELESVFVGAGWNVVKVVWGRRWDALLAQDREGALVHALNSIPDGQFQTFAAESGAYIRERLGADPAVAALLAPFSDDELVTLLLDRGGHDVHKIHAGYAAACAHKGAPTVVLAQTIKGRGLGREFEARNATHQLKKFASGALVTFRDRLDLPIPDADIADGMACYYRPEDNSPELAYLLARRKELGGFVPKRRSAAPALAQPGEETYARLRAGSGQQEVATTMALVRLVKELLRVPKIGPRIVPIIPDEARTFGVDALFPQLKIYSPRGQRYEAVDRDMLMHYNEHPSGQILHEGITEAGAMGSFTAAGSSYATFGQPMIPLYLFYSMFGFQRTGDLAWSAADQRCRGFLVGATAGRTTLNGEGLQHGDGHSLLLASTNPACISYDPAFAFELAPIMADALRRMYGPSPEDIFYYLTVYNEPFKQPAMPADVDDRAIVQGMYRYAVAPQGRHHAQILTSGSAMLQALGAQQLLAQDWDVAADVWSVTSWQQLRQEALDCEQHNRMHPTEQPKVPYLTQSLGSAQGPVVAVTDWIRAVPDQIARWIPEGHGYAALGTDGFGRSGTREGLRRWFGIDPASIAVGVLYELALAGAVKRELVGEAIARYELDPEATTALP